MKVNIKLPLINLVKGNEALKKSLDYELIDKMLDELQWYRSQDLIPRNIAQAVIAKPISSSAEYCKAVQRIAEIPKAEPPKEDSQY